MKILLSMIALCLSVQLAAAADASATQTATQPSAVVPATAALDIKCKKDDDTIVATTDDGKTILSVTSKSGIGSATVARQAGSWPKIVLRFYLRGLEGLHISNGLVKLDADLCSQGDGKRLNLTQDGKKGPPLAPASPYGLDIHILDAQGKPAKKLPKDGGYFEVAIPPALLTGDAKQLTLEWVDFYRM